MKIIGISGKCGAGKSTLANHLIGLLGEGWRRVSFAGVLKEEVSSLFNIPLEWCYTEAGKNTKVNMIHRLTDGGIVPPYVEMTVRDILQWWGTDVRRAKEPGYWAHKMANTLTVLSLGRGCKGVIIDDVRFPDEAGLVKTASGFLIRLETYPEWRCNERNAIHASELALDGYRGWDLLITPEFGKLQPVAELAAKMVAGQDPPENTEAVSWSINEEEVIANAT